MFENPVAGKHDLRRTSYTAANAIPLKVVKHSACQVGIQSGRIFPVHVQFIPTDRCNLDCAWCSCAEDSRKTTMPLERIEQLVAILSRWNTKAVTITGGGEPMMHPHISDVFKIWDDTGIEIGLVSSAYLFPHKLKAEDFARIKWCRVSVSDDRKGVQGIEGGSVGIPQEGDKLTEAMNYAVAEGPDVDWAFSYVVTAQFDLEKFIYFVEYATRYNFTHMRAVSDLFDLQNVPTMKWIAASLKERGVNDDVVVYQGRKEFERGQEKCLTSLLKPVIGADGKVFPCCGAQYALKTPSKMMPDQLCMGTIDDLDTIMAEQNGRVCHRCYYGDYNRLLEGVMSDIDHLNFV